MPAYSFLSVNAAMLGPGGVLNLGAGAAVAEEGITISPIEDKNAMTIGADGKGQHSLIASDACSVTIRLLKTSPVNAQLMALYDLQSASPALWGQNVFKIDDASRGDSTIVQAAAFKKKPELTYAKEAGFNEWTFDGIQANTILGS